jgi:hypothetical protein
LQSVYFARRAESERAVPARVDRSSYC